MTKVIALPFPEERWQSVIKYLKQFKRDNLADDLQSLLNSAETGIWLPITEGQATMLTGAVNIMNTLLEAINAEADEEWDDLIKIITRAANQDKT